MHNLLRNLAYASVIVASITVVVCQLTRPAQATPPQSTLVDSYLGATNSPTVIMDNGDVWHRDGWGPAPPTYLGNFWGDTAVNVEAATWSKVKSGVR